MLGCMKPPPALSKPPDATSLRAAALAHLARFAASEAGLARVLERRVDRWARAAERAGLDAEAIAVSVSAARCVIPPIIASLRAIGAVNDAEFAASMARRLARSGKSRLAALAHLAARGIDRELAADLVPEDPEQSLASACIALRRRRLPPFGEGDRLRALATLARAGFDRRTAERALALDAEEAEARIIAARRES